MAVGRLAPGSASHGKAVQRLRELAEEEEDEPCWMRKGLTDLFLLTYVFGRSGNTDGLEVGFDPSPNGISGNRSTYKYLAVVLKT